MAALATFRAPPIQCAHTPRRQQRLLVAPHPPARVRDCKETTLRCGVRAHAKRRDDERSSRVQETFVDVAKEIVRRIPPQQLAALVAVGGVGLLLVGPALLAVAMTGATIALSMVVAGSVIVPMMMGLASLAFVAAFLFPIGGMLLPFTFMGLVAAKSIAMVVSGALGFGTIAALLWFSSNKGSKVSSSVIDVEPTLRMGDDEEAQEEAKKRKLELEEFDELLRRREAFKNRI